MANTNRVTLTVAIAAIAMGTGLLVRDTRSQVPPPAARAEPPQDVERPRRGPAFMLKVVDRADRSPLPEAPVWVRATGHHVRTWEGTTDAQGRCAIVAPDQETRSFEITVATAGYALGGLRSSVGVPDYTLELERAEAIGGVLQDEQGRPIEGARVFATIYPYAQVPPEVYASPNSAPAIATTDAHGRWQADALPVGTRPETRVRVLVTHPDHVAAEFRTMADKARAFASSIAMRTGLSLSGTVLSPFGRPVPGATVVVAPPAWDETFLRFTTDEEGRFRSGRCLDPGWSKVVMMVQAPGLSWDFRDVAVSPAMPPVVVRLTRRRPIEGRVLDVQGKPVMGAVVSCNRSYFTGLIDWECKTNASGRFVWYDAPTEGVLLLDVSRPGFQPFNRSVVRPGTDGIAITLHPQ